MSCFNLINQYKFDLDIYTLHVKCPYWCVFIFFKEIMVGTEYQAEVPLCLCHYKDGEKGECCFQCITLICTYII